MEDIFYEIPVNKNDKRFTGPISMNTFVDKEEVRGHYVRFFEGARTNVHTHTSEQALICCEGEGIVVFLKKIHEQGSAADKYLQEGNSVLMKKGDMIIIPKDIPHYHGSNNKNLTFGHIAILTNAAKTDWDNECAFPLENS